MIVLAAAGSLSLPSGGSGGGLMQPPFTARDLPGIVAPKPELPPKEAYVEDTINQGGSVVRLTKFSPQVSPTLKRAGFQTGRQKAWKSERVFTEAVALVFGDAAGAHASFAAVRALAKRNATPGSFSAEKLEQEGFRLHTRLPDEELLVTAWRTGNLIVFTSMECENQPCAFDVAAAEAPWVHAIDMRTRRR
jgi:hypothetical protein